ncbi:DUF6875 domain-containing protein [Nocardia arthritidis]|uniref:DUF6875 domain-containing protein n=1 Tax=Nocardia arthritidis TaxID=228602 RepID=A0A6G9Y8A4_9NOCA|nr:hypothetical protein [Nocardia arthritidis]QIS09296.1 hypothetical protein F5544_06930 [Nocardia arthritidis]
MTKIVIGPRSGMNWIPLSSIEKPCPFAGSAVGVVRAWVEDHLTSSAPELGRDGPICPYVGPSIRRDLMWVGRIPGIRPLPDFVRLVLADALEVFPRLPPVDGGAAVLRTLITALPDLCDHSLIDELHAELKTEFVARATMLGQFYPGCAQPGLWNKDFHPLDAPIPMLVVRSMMATDFPFLLERPEWMSAYVKKFAPALPAHVRHAVVRRLTANPDTKVAAYRAAPDDEPMPAGRRAD